MSLAKLTQRMAYKGVQQWNKKAERRKTTIMIGHIRAAAKEDWNVNVSENKIWTSIRQPDMRRTLRDFWWKATHDALRIGEYWEKIEGYEHRGQCSHCGVTENLEHIMLECDAPGQKEVWDAVRAMVRKKNDKQWNISIGSLLAIPTMSSWPPSKKGSKWDARFVRILFTESAHLIWKMRCERVIEHGGDPGKYHARREIRARWLSAINGRLKMDQNVAHPRVKKGRIKPQIVHETWKGVLEDEGALPPDWYLLKGVLVGKPLQWQRQDAG
ncbi:hypothetical protein C8Q78DRAFT_1069673 [Trametes maxima]|nr:hypothetical protein C8Q78DRAFT_1069673 [Trametes maxima]